MRHRDVQASAKILSTWDVYLLAYVTHARCQTFRDITDHVNQDRIKLKTICLLLRNQITRTKGQDSASVAFPMPQVPDLNELIASDERRDVTCVTH